MVKYKFTITWFILFVIAMTIAIVTMSGSEEQDAYNPGVIMGAVLVLLCCPAFIIDYRQTEKYKGKQEEKKLKLQLQQKQLELAIKEHDLDFEKRKIALEHERVKLTEKQVSDKQVLTKFCKYCGKEIEEVASICPFCGSDLIIKEEKILPQQPQPPAPTQVVIQQVQQPSFLRKIAEWIVSEIIYCIFFTIMTTFLIVMLLVLTI